MSKKRLFIIAFKEIVQKALQKELPEEGDEMDLIKKAYEIVAIKLQHIINSEQKNVL